MIEDFSSCTVSIPCLTKSLSQPFYLQAAIGSGGDGVYDVTRHDEPPNPIPNPEDPQYSHIQQGEEEKKKKEKKKKENVTKVI